MASLADGKPRRQAEQQFDRSIKMITAWRFVDWYSLLIDDAHSCGPHQSTGTHSLCGGCGDTIGALTMPPSDVDASLRCVTQAPKRASTCSSVPVVEEDVGCGEKRRRLDVRVDCTGADCTGSDGGDVQFPWNDVDSEHWPDADDNDSSLPPSPDHESIFSDGAEW